MPFASAIQRPIPAVARPQRPGRIALQAVAAARQRQDQHTVERGQKQIGLGVALGHALVHRGRGGTAAGGADHLKGEHLHALGRSVQLHGLHVVKGGAAGVFAAVAAHAQHQRDLRLILAGFAVHAELAPLAGGVQHRFGVHEGVFKGKRRAVARVAAVLCAHHAAEAVVAVRLHVDGLGKARVVGVGVDHHGAAALVAVLREVQAAHAAVGIPHSTGPVHRQARCVRFGEIAVDHQVFAGVGQGSARTQRQQRAKQHCEDSFHFGKKLLTCGIIQLYHFHVPGGNSFAFCGKKRTFPETDRKEGCESPSQPGVMLKGCRGTP